LQWLQYPSEINGNSLNTVIREVSRHFRNKKRVYLEDKINVLTDSKNKNIRELHRGINKFKKGYQPKSNFVMDENGALLANSQNILNRRTTFLSY
jgi:hypothetical protein